MVTTVYNVLVEELGFNEQKALSIYSPENKQDMDAMPADKKAKYVCPVCKRGVKIRLTEFVNGGCPKCGTRLV